MFSEAFVHGGGGGGVRETPHLEGVLTSIGGHYSGRYASNWNAFCAV